jgi:hypothetical protein
MSSLIGTYFRGLGGRGCITFKIYFRNVVFNMEVTFFLEMSATQPNFVFYNATKYVHMYQICTTETVLIAYFPVWNAVKSGLLTLMLINIINSSQLAVGVT